LRSVMPDKDPHYNIRKLARWFGGDFIPPSVREHPKKWFEHPIWWITEVWDEFLFKKLTNKIYPHRTKHLYEGKIHIVYIRPNKHGIWGNGLVVMKARDFKELSVNTPPDERESYERENEAVLEMPIFFQK